MNILVTGATGFLGTTLCRHLREAGHDVIALGSRDADLLTKGSLDRFADRLDQVYHLAAWTQAGDFCLKHPGEQWVLNQLINTHVLEWWQRVQPQAKLITMGTSCSYSPDLPLREEHYLDGTPIESLFTYAHTKRMLLVGQMALRKQFGLTWLTLVPSTLYGPGYHTDGRQMHFIFDLIRKVVRGRVYDETVVLWGNGQQKRELVYVDDFCAAAVALADSCDNELVNVGAGEEHTIRHFATIICDLVGYDFGRIQFDTSKYVGAPSKCLATDHFRQYLPAWRQVPLEEGISRTIQWYARANDLPLPGPGA